jgi:hypothetical protein
MTDVSEELIVMVLMMEAVSSSETSVNIFQTTWHISQDIHLQKDILS